MVFIYKSLGEAYLPLVACPSLCICWVCISSHFLWWNDIGQNHANTINGQYRFTTYYEGLGHTFLSHFWWPRAPHIVPIKSFCAPFGALGLGVCSVSGLSGSLANQKVGIVLLYLCQWLQIDIKYINIIITLCSSCIHVAWRPRYRTAIASWANFLFPLNQSIYT